MTDLTLKEIAKAGVLFLVMGVAIYVLWQKQSQSDERLSAEINQLKKDNKECTTTYQNLLLDQLTKTTIVIEDNTKALNCIK